jgi:hypothetical protein
VLSSPNAKALLLFPDPARERLPSPLTIAVLLSPLKVAALLSSPVVVAELLSPLLAFARLELPVTVALLLLPPPARATPSLPRTVAVLSLPAMGAFWLIPAAAELLLPTAVATFRLPPSAVALAPAPRACALELVPLAEDIAVPRWITVLPLIETLMLFCRLRRGSDFAASFAAAMRLCASEAAGWADAAHGAAASPSPIPSATANAPTRPMYFADPTTSPLPGPCRPATAFSRGHPRGF